MIARWYVAIFAAAAAITVQQHSTARQSFEYTCVPLHSKKAEIWRGVVGTSVVSNVTKAREQANALNLDPRISKCLGSLDMSLFDALAILTDRDCNLALQQVMPRFDPPFDLDTTLAPRYQRLLDDVSAIWKQNKGNVLNLATAMRMYLHDKLSPFMYADVTDLMQTKVSRCMHKTIIPLMFRHMFDHSFGCCADLKKMFQSSTNQAFAKPYIQSMAMSLLDVLFTTREGNQESCMYSIVQTFLGPTAKLDMKHALAIPQSQACPAALGDEFHSHVNNGSVYQYRSAIGCCTNSLDAVVSHVKEFPIVMDNFPPAVFAPNDFDCIEATELPLVQKLILAVADDALKKEIISSVTGVCLHIASGISPCANADQCSTVSSYVASSTDDKISVEMQHVRP